MSARALAEVILGVLGIYWALIDTAALWSSACAMWFAKDLYSEVYGHQLGSQLAATAGGVACGLILFKGRRKIAGWITSDERPAPPLQANNLLNVGIVFIGVWFVASGVSGIAGNLYDALDAERSMFIGILLGNISFALVGGLLILLIPGPRNAFLEVVRPMRSESGVS